MIPTAPLTLDDFLKLPEQRPRLEYLDGVATQRESHNVWQGMIQMEFCSRVNRYAEPRRLAMAFPGVRATFGGASVVLPVGVYRWDRIPRRADGRLGDDALSPWDIALEFDFGHPGALGRCQRLCDLGIGTLFVANPAREAMWLVKPEKAPELLDVHQPLDLDVMLPGLTLTPADLFAALYPG